MTELEYWTQQIKKGRINRREFMGRAAALGATTALATSLLAGAGIAQEGKAGGYAKFGLAHGATTDTLDPANYPDTGTQVPFWGSMSNSLTEVDADGNVQPDLAETMEPSDDAMPTTTAAITPCFVVPFQKSVLVRAGRFADAATLNAQPTR